MFYGTGNPVQTSTQVTEVSNPTTATILAEITGLGGETNRAGKEYEARIVLGASTLAVFWLEQCQSSGLGSTALSTTANCLGRRTLYATIHQSAQYCLRFTAQPNDRLRVRVAGDHSTFTGTVAATLQVEALA